MKITDAAGVKGILLTTIGSDVLIFRVYKKDYSFTDYDLRHCDLEVTISSDYEAAFYDEEDGSTPILDHAPLTLGIKGQFDDHPDLLEDSFDEDIF